MKILILLLSFNCFAISQKESKELFTRYLDSIRSKEESKFKANVSPKYFKQLKKKKMIKEMFKMNKRSKSKLNFDLEIKKAALDTETFYVNIKNKTDKHYGHNWFKVIKLDGKYKIDGTEFFD